MIFLKSQHTKSVKVHDLGTKQLDQRKQKRQLGAGGSQDLAQPSCAEGVCGRQLLTTGGGLTEEDGTREDRSRDQTGVLSGFPLSPCGRTSAGSPKES